MPKVCKNDKSFVPLIGTTTLDTVDASKYLGVTISNNLTWDRHTGTQAHRQHNWQRQQNIGIYSTQPKRLHQTSEISSIYIHDETNNGICKLSMGPDKPEKD